MAKNLKNLPAISGCTWNNTLTNSPSTLVTSAPSSPAITDAEAVAFSPSKKLSSPKVSS